MVTPSAAALAENVSCRVDLIGLDQRIADRDPLGHEKGIRHPAPDQDTIQLGQQVEDQTDLVGDLGTSQESPCRDARESPAIALDALSSACMRRPATATGRNFVIPSVEAWARCAVPKASLT